MLSINLQAWDVSEIADNLESSLFGYKSEFTFFQGARNECTVSMLIYKGYISYSDLLKTKL